MSRTVRIVCDVCGTENLENFGDPDTDGWVQDPVVIIGDRKIESGARDACPACIQQLVADVRLAVVRWTSTLAWAIHSLRLEIEALEREDASDRQA